MKNKQSISSHKTGLLQGIAYSRLHANLTKILAAYNLSIPEWKLLGQLYDHGNVRLTQLSDLLSYDPPLVTKLTKQLEKKGLLRREYDQFDERAKVIILTTSAVKLLSQVDPVVKLKLGEILQGITQAELRTYIKVLEAIVRNTVA